MTKPARPGFVKARPLRRFPAAMNAAGACVEDIETDTRHMRAALNGSTGNAP